MRFEYYSNIINQARKHYYPLGCCRNSTGDLGTDKLFTGQRRDIATAGAELYYYGGRYYDPTIGRFISPDPLVQWSNGLDLVSYQLTVNIIPLGLGSVGNLQVTYPRAVLAVPMNPQALNRYSYVLNNPLKYTDPTGYYDLKKIIAGAMIIGSDVIFSGALIVITAIYAQPALPLAIKVVEYLGTPTLALGLYLIYEGNRDSNEPSTPQLPIEKKPLTPAPLTSPSGDTTPEPELPVSPTNTSGPPPELVAVHEKYGGILEQLPDGTWHVLI